MLFTIKATNGKNLELMSHHTGDDVITKFSFTADSEKVPFTKMAFKFEQSNIFQFFFDFLKAKRTIFNIFTGF